MNVDAGERRCTALGQPFHRFFSPDRIRQRICPACVARAEAQESETYKVRFLVEPWNKPAPPGDRTRPGLDVLTDQYGYTDRLITVSIVNEGTPDEEVSIADSEKGDPRAFVERLRALIEQLERSLT